MAGTRGASGLGSVSNELIDKTNYLVLNTGVQPS